MRGIRFFLLILIFPLAFATCKKNSDENVQMGETLMRIIGSGVLRVGMEPCELPYCGLNPQTNRIEGFEVDINNLLVARMNARYKPATPVKLEIVPVKWQRLPNELLGNKIDIIGNAWTPTDETKGDIAWSLPYYEWGLVVAVLRQSGVNAIADIRGNIVGHYDDPSSDALFRKLGLRYKIYDDANDAFRDLVNGKIIAYIYDSPFLLYHAKRSPQIKIIGEKLSNSTYNYGIRKEETDLQQFVNQAVTDMRASAEYGAVLKKWFD